MYNILNRSATTNPEQVIIDVFVLASFIATTKKKEIVVEWFS